MLIAYLYDNLRNVKIVLTGSKVGLLYRLLRIDDPDSPLFGRPIWRFEMGYFTHEDARRFLYKVFEDVGIDISDEEVDDVLNRLGNVPGWLSYYGYLRIQGYGHDETLDETRSYAAKLVKQELENFSKA